MFFFQWCHQYCMAKLFAENRKATLKQKCSPDWLTEKLAMSPAKGIRTTLHPMALHNTEYSTRHRWTPVKFASFGEAACNDNVNVLHWELQTPLVCFTKQGLHMGYHVLVIGYRLLAGLRGLSGVFFQIFSLETKWVSYPRRVGQCHVQRCICSIITLYYFHEHWSYWSKLGYAEGKSPILRLQSSNSSVSSKSGSPCSTVKAFSLPQAHMCAHHGWRLSIDLNPGPLLGPEICAKSKMRKNSHLQTQNIRKSSGMS